RVRGGRHGFGARRPRREVEPRRELAYPTHLRHMVDLRPGRTARSTTEMRPTADRRSRMMSDGSLKTNATTRLQHPVDRARDHIRGGGAPDKVSVLSHTDLLCSYCQRLRRVLVRLREALRDRLEYVFRH